MQSCGRSGDKKVPHPLLLLRRGSVEFGLEQSLGSGWMEAGKMGRSIEG